MASTTQKRAKALPTTGTVTGFDPSTGLNAQYNVVENFAVFIDTHRDQPHVPTFEDDIHRGMSRPTPVHYVPPMTKNPNDLGALIRVEDDRMIDVDPKHKFVTNEWWQDFVMDYALAHGTAPIATSGEQKGQLPTSHLRDARRRVYHLKSLRQMVMSYTPTGTATGTAYKPSRTKRKI